MYDAVTSPVHKPSNVQRDQRIPTRRNFQELTQGNINDQAIEFFPEQRSNPTLIEDKYRNPLQGNDRKRLIAMGFTLDRVLIPDNANIDLVAAINDLRHATVVLQRGSRKEEVLDLHINRFIDFSRCQLHEATYDNGTNSGSRLVWQVKTLPMKRLADTSFRNTLFDSKDHLSLKLQFDSVSNIPSAGDWSYDDVKIGAFIQLARNARVRGGSRSVR